MRRCVPTWLLDDVDAARTTIAGWILGVWVLRLWRSTVGLQWYRDGPFEWASWRRLVGYRLGAAGGRSRVPSRDAVGGLCAPRGGAPCSTEGQRERRCVHRPRNRGARGCIVDWTGVDVGARSGSVEGPVPPSSAWPDRKVDNVIVPRQVLITLSTCVRR